MTGCKQALPASLGWESKAGGNQSFSDEKARAGGPGLFLRAYALLSLEIFAAALRSSHGVEGARYLLLDRLRRIGGDLGGQRSDFGSLTRKHVELMANEGRL